MGQAVPGCHVACRNDCQELGQYCERGDGTSFTERSRRNEEVDLSGLVGHHGKTEKISLEVNDQQQLTAQSAMMSMASSGESPAVSSGLSPGKRKPFLVELSRTGQNWKTLGLLVSPDDDPRYLVVDDIWEPSLIADWNTSHSESMRVKPGDVITSVNESSCSGEGMLAKIQALGKGASLRLKIG
eukprot:TRINITY_DN925_c0_g1_i1.p1 TRINITY_DN925_c0_g1~~TRINITY_DN925_c0_g1_i1.p1  ORF type:complete len:185 (-),score=31.47 TRINITY_DN925_c0_g1_i1:421-975(-)